jgi:hypothetical protein
MVMPQELSNLGPHFEQSTSDSASDDDVHAYRERPVSCANLDGGWPEEAFFRLQSVGKHA